MRAAHRGADDGVDAIPSSPSAVPQLMQQQSTWKATASHESDRAVRAFGTAGWSTVVPQQPGMWFQFELPEPMTLTELQLPVGGTVRPAGRTASAAPYARGYTRAAVDGRHDVERAGRGRAGHRAVHGRSRSRRRDAKFVRITQTATTENAPPWAIQQLQLYELRPERPLRSARASE